jgi:type II secretory pathway pseudopilin PulG
MLARLRRLPGHPGGGLRGGGRRASVAVEFALLSTFLLLPLLAGASDFVVIIAAQAQLNTALDALYMYAETNPSRATTAGSGYTTSGQTTTDIQVIIANINQNTTDYKLSLPQYYTGTSYNGSATYVCYQSGNPSVPTFQPPSTTACSGSYPVSMTFANYKVTVAVNLPFPLPIHLASPLTLSASGSVQTQ